MTTFDHCERRTDVAAFLLGALTPSEERDTMVHLPDCADCQATLAELIHMPELLARVPRSLIELMDRSAYVDRRPISAAGARGAATRRPRPR